MTAQTRLQKFDIDDLDAYEYQKFNSTIGFLSKVESLQLIIDSCGGDFSNLSDGLADIAEEQLNEL
jgi:hypothetical protein